MQAETFRADSESARKFAFQAALSLTKLPLPLYKGTLLDPGLELRSSSKEPVVDSAEGARLMLETATLHPDVGLQTYVNQLGRWLSLESPYPDAPWTFAVVEGEVPQPQDHTDMPVSAWRSGHVFVRYPVVQQLKTEAELASLLALGIAQAVRARASASPHNALALSSAADEHMAVVLLARTGFNPTALIDALRHTSTNGTGLTFMSALLGNDASTRTRVAGLRQFMGTRFDDYRRPASPSPSQRLASLAAASPQ